MGQGGCEWEMVICKIKWRKTRRRKVLFQSWELLFRRRKKPFGWLEGVSENRDGSFFGQFLVAFSLLFWL